MTDHTRTETMDRDAANKKTSLAARTDPFPAYIAAPKMVKGPKKLVCVVGLDRPAPAQGTIVNLTCRQLNYAEDKAVNGVWSVRFELDLSGVQKETLLKLVARCNGQTKEKQLPVHKPGRVRPIYVPITVGVPDAVEGGGVPFSVTVVIDQPVQEAAGWPMYAKAVPASGSAGAPFSNLSDTAERPETIVQNYDYHTFIVTTSSVAASWFGQVHVRIQDEFGVDRELDSGEFEVYP
jgi:hypothetical protein